MSEMQAQCWICPHCFDDHATNADCKESDLKEAVDYLKQENAELKRKLEKAVEALEWYAIKGEGPYSDARIYRRAESALETLRKAGLV